MNSPPFMQEVTQFLAQAVALRRSGPCSTFEKDCLGVASSSVVRSLSGKLTPVSSSTMLMRIATGRCTAPLCPGVMACKPTLRL